MSYLAIAGTLSSPLWGCLGALTTEWNTLRGGQEGKGRKFQ